MSGAYSMHGKMRTAIQNLHRIIAREENTWETQA